MPNAYRAHFQPAAEQFLPGADPYILSLVQAIIRPAAPRGGVERDLERRSEALSASFDRGAEPFVIWQERGSDCLEIRVDRRCAPRRWAQSGRRREARAAV